MAIRNYFFYFLYIEQLWQLETLLRGMVNNDEGTKLAGKGQTLTRAMIPRKYRTPASKFFSLTIEYIHEKWRRIWVIALWLATNLVLYIWKDEQFKQSPLYKISGSCLCHAKASAEILKLNMALILLPVCRRTLTMLRSTFLGAFLPFDDNINFHKLIALAIVIATTIHTLMHMACNFPLLSSCPKDKFMAIAGPLFHYHQPTYWFFLQTNVGITGILMIFIMAFSFTLATHQFRKNVIKLPGAFHKLAGFNAFWYTHHLLALAYILLFSHGYFLIFEKPWHTKTVCTVLATSLSKILSVMYSSENFSIP